METAAPAEEFPTQPNDARPEQSVPVPAPDMLWHLALCLAAGGFFDYFFRTHRPGLSVLLFVLFILSIMAWSFRDRLRPGMNFETFSPAPIVLLAASYLFFTNPVFNSINAILLPILLILLMHLWAKAARHPWYDARISGDLARTLFRMPAGAVRPAITLVREAPLQPSVRTAMTKVAIGLAISVPLLVIILVLLTSADQMFLSYVDRVAAFLTLDMQTAISHLFHILLPALVLSGLLWTLRAKKPSDAASNLPEGRRNWDALILSTVLVSMNVIYALFCWIQFSYLFSGVQGDLPQGLTYAEYARRGFFELVLITLLNTVIVSGGVYLVRQEQGFSCRLARILLSLLVAQSLIILASSFTRLSLYESFYGYTYMRLFARTMIVFMGVVLLLLSARTWREKFPFWKCFLLSALLIYAGLNYFNIDRFIAEKNVARYHETGRLDIAYLRGLSFEAVPQIAALARGENPEISRIMKQELVERRVALEELQGFPEFNFSRRRAALLLDTRQ